MVKARAFRAGALYCLVVFGAALVLGVVRNAWVAPLAGDIVAFVVEAPIMLAVAWFACGWTAKRMDVSRVVLDRLAMGGAALGALVCAEALVAILTDGHTLAEYLGQYGRSAILLGLTAQIALAVFPLLRRRGV